MDSYYDTYVHEPYVKENQFLKEQPSEWHRPPFDVFRNACPKLLWPSHDSVRSAHEFVWDTLYKTIMPGNPFLPKPFIDTCFNGHLFMWDSCFIMQYAKYVNPTFDAYGTLDDLYARQHPDGFICREIDEQQGVDRFHRYDPSSTGPNVLAWTEWSRYLFTNDTNRLSKVFSPLFAYHRFLRKYRTWQDGSYFTSGWGSGMDNLPRVPQSFSREFDHGHVSYVDATCQAILSADSLIHIANVLGRSEECKELVQERDALRKWVLTHMWDEESGFFFDLDRHHQKTNVMSIASYWALLSGVATQRQAELMVKQLFNPHTFFLDNVIPGLSKSDPEYGKDLYWKGGVWASTNWMVFEGLRKYGYHLEAHLLAKRYLDAVIRDFEKTHTLWEVYESSGGEHMSYARPDFVGWSGMIPTAVVYEFVFGIHVDLPRQTIEWHILLDEPHGVSHLTIDGQTITLEATPNTDAFPNIRFEGAKNLTLRVFWNQESRVYHAK